MAYQIDVFNQIDVKDAKVGMIIRLGTEGNFDYIKISELNHVKNGKHGSAKIYIKGKNIIKGTNFTDVYTGGSLIQQAKLVKCVYNAIDFVDGILSVQSIGCDDGGEVEELDVRTLLKADEIKKIEDALSGGEAADRCELVLTRAPGYMELVSVKAMMQSK